MTTFSENSISLNRDVLNFMSGRPCCLLSVSTSPLFVVGFEPLISPDGGQHIWAGRTRVRGHRVLFTDQFIDLFAVNADLLGRLDAQSHLISSDLEDLQGNRVPDPDSFTGLPCQYQHGSKPSWSYSPTADLQSYLLHSLSTEKPNRTLASVDPTPQKFSVFSEPRQSLVINGSLRFMFSLFA